MSRVFILNKRRQEQDATAYILSDVHTQILTHWINPNWAQDDDIWRNTVRTISTWYLMLKTEPEVNAM